MLNPISRLRIVALLVVVASPALVRAQALADRVPADTTLYFGWQGVDSAAPGFAGSHLQAVLADSNIPRVIDEFLPKVLDRIAQEDKHSAEGIEIARALLGPMVRHPSAIAIVGVDMAGANGPSPKAVLMCQAGNEAAVLKAKIDELVKQAGQPPFPVHVVQKADLIALIIGYAKPEDGLIDAGPGGKSLANDPAFAKALSHVGKQGFLTGYVDVEKLLGLAEMAAGFGSPEIQKNWTKARDMLGLKGIQRAIWTEGFDGKDWASKAFVAAPAPRTGFFGSMIDGKPLSPEVFHSIPENATLAGGVHFDLAGLVAALRGAVASIDDNAAKQVDQGVGQINQMLGLDVEKDFLGSLGDEWAYYLDPAVAGNSLLGATLINRLKDPAKAEANFTKVETFINQVIAEQAKHEKVVIAFRQAKFGGTTVHYLGFPFITPAWAVEHGNLYFALYPEVVGAAAGHVPGQGKSILENPSFQSVMKQLGDHPNSSFAYVDLPRLAPQTYGTWMAISHVANAGDLFGIPAPLQILPPFPKLVPHLTAMGQCTWTDADGLHLSAHVPFPGAQLFASDPSSMSVAQVALVSSLMMPALGKAREQAQHAKSSANLRQIGLTAIQYSNDHNGKYPKDLGELCVASGMQIGIFISPSSSTTAPQGLSPEQAKEWVAQNSDYVWNGAGKSADKLGAEDALAWENPDRAHNGINILYGDYHVEFHPTYDAMQIIEKAKAVK
jgi:hypothetical protein